MITRLLFYTTLGFLSLPFSSSALLAGPSPQQKTTKKSQKSPRTKMINAYNAGVKLMLLSKHSAAQNKFEQALEHDAQFAEAHNNLAYVLRKQGKKNHSKALVHYNKAIALKPKMAEAYMYRGVLHVQMGQVKNANEDLKKLYALKSKLAKELEHVLQTGEEKQPAQFFGVSKRLPR